MLPLLVEYLLRNRVTFIAFNTHLQLYRMSFFDSFPLLELMAASVEDISVRAVGFSGSLVLCCPFALILMWEWRMFLRTLGNISLLPCFVSLPYDHLVCLIPPNILSISLMIRRGFARVTVCLFVTGRRVWILFGVLEVVACN
jgi:hypothetical protein